MGGQETVIEISAGYADSVGAGRFSGTFSDPFIRRRFIQKVYSLLSVQLAFSFAVISVFVFNDGVKKWAFENQWLFFVALIGYIAIFIALVCSPSLQYKHPQNLIFLALITVLFSIVGGFAAALYDPTAVVTAFALTLIVTLSVTLFSVSTKFDFTSCGGLLCCLTWLLVVFGFVIAIIPMLITSENGDQTQARLSTIYAVLGVILFSLWLAYDTQQVIGGRKYQLSEEEYVIATLMLYVDIMQIFLFLLQLMGVRK